MSRRYPYSFPKGLRWEVLIRDGGCVLHFLEPGHRCFDVWQQEHAWNDTEKCTLEHVKREGSMMGKRPPTDIRHLVALDGATNFKPPSHEQRELMRAYLDRVAP